MKLYLLSVLFVATLSIPAQADSKVAENERSEVRDTVQEFYDALIEQDLSDLHNVTTDRLRNRFSDLSKTKNLIKELQKNDILIGNPTPTTKFFSYKQDSSIGYRSLILEILQKNEKNHRYSHLLDVAVTCEYRDVTRNVVEAFTGYEIGDHVKSCQVSDIK